jgi:hypothetical protein
MEAYLSLAGLGWFRIKLSHHNNFMVTMLQFSSPGLNQVNLTSTGTLDVFYSVPTRVVWCMKLAKRNSTKVLKIEKMEVVMPHHM